jgi:hypothetical protein
MLGWNRLIKTPGKLRLEIISSELLKLIKAVWLVLSIGSIGLWAFAFYRFFFSDSGFNWLPALAGVGLLLVANFIRMALDLLKRLDNRYIFDLEQKVLTIEYEQIDYAFLPKSIPLSRIESLRLLTMKPGESSAPWQLELIFDDDKFFPLTAFKDERKARHIVQELQQALHCPFREAPAPDISFKEYKQLFLQQFKPQG